MKKQKEIKLIVWNLALSQSLTCAVGVQMADSGAFDNTMLVWHPSLCIPDHGLVPFVRLVCSVNSQTCFLRWFNMLICLYFPNMFCIPL